MRNERGMKIHQGKSKCKEPLQQRKATYTTQRAISEFISTFCQSVEDQDQEGNHSAPDLSAQSAQSTRRGGESESLESVGKKPCLNLPPAADRRWAQLDIDLSITLDNILKGDATKKIKTMVQVVYQACQDTFGVREGKTVKPPAGSSRRQRQIIELRKELRMLKKRWKKADKEGKEAMNQLSSELRKSLLQLCRTETIPRKQREKR